MSGKQFTVGSLFAGIGGIDLGFERAGFKTAWQVEIDPYCQRVLAKNFPHAERFEDVRTVGLHNLSAVDVIVGGFPCQDISNAGKRAGITGERSGLWTEYARIVRELRPRFVFVENVAALLGRGMGVVLGDLAKIGYDSEWQIVSAADMGAPHLRERVWIVAYACSIGYSRPSAPYATALDEERYYSSYRSFGRAVADSLESGSEDVAHSTRKLRDWSRASAEQAGSTKPSDDGWWVTEPSVGRVANGIPKRVDRLRGLGNSVVPQIPELFAHRIHAALEIK